MKPDWYSAECHDFIIATIKDNAPYKLFPTYDSETIKKQVKDPTSTILGLIGHAEDINVAMIRFSIAIIKHSEEHPEEFPSTSWETVEADVIHILSTLAGLHGFHPHGYAMFYCGFLCVINITTGSRIKLNGSFSDGKPAPKNPLRQAFHYNGEEYTFLYKAGWLPTRTALGPPPADDIRFITARRLAQEFVVTNDTICRITELGFGYADIKVPVLVVITPPDVELPEEYFSKPFVHIFVHINEDVTEINERASTEDQASQTRQEGPPEPKDETFRDRMRKLILKDFIPDPDVTDEKDQLRARGKHLSELKTLAANGLPQGLATQAPENPRNIKLYHGASLSPVDELTRGSFGLYLFCDEWKDIITYITASHVAPYPSILQAPATLDIIRQPLRRFATSRSSDFCWAGTDDEIEEMCRRELEGRTIVGEVLHSMIGDSDWRVNYSLIRSLVDEDPQNGFGHLKDLYSVAEKIFEEHKFAAGSDEEIWWHKVGKDELREAFSTILSNANPSIYDGTDMMFKYGATTGLRSGKINGRQLETYKKHTAESATTTTDLYERWRGSSTVDSCMHDIILCEHTDNTSGRITFEDFCAKGDSGSAVLKMICIAPMTWRIVWKGLLVSHFNSEKTNGSMGLMVPAEAIIKQLKEATGYTFRPSPVRVGSI